MVIQRFTRLEVWKKAHAAVLELHKQTKSFPSSERFVLGAQMRRAGISVPANIAEGSGRRKPSDKAHFYAIARSSAEELRYYYILALDLGYLGEAVCRAAEEALDEVCRMLFGIIESMEERGASGRSN